jgi:hypothetical protein
MNAIPLGAHPVRDALKHAKGSRARGAFLRLLQE